MVMQAMKILFTLLVASLPFVRPHSHSKDSAADADGAALLQTNVTFQNLKPYQNMEAKVTWPLQKAWAEGMGTAMYVFIDCACHMGLPESDSKFAQVALTTGFGYSALAYTFMHYGGVSFNPAITIGRYCINDLTVGQCTLNIFFQLLGAVVGSLATLILFNEKQDQTGTTATNTVQIAFSYQQAFLGESVGTFLLAYVFFECLVNSATAGNRGTACLVIGLVIFLGHSVMLPVDGCSLNPARSFGPKVVRRMFRAGKMPIVEGQHDPDGVHSHMHSFGIEPYVWQFWFVFIVGPVCGSLVAAVAYHILHGTWGTEVIG